MKDGYLIDAGMCRGSMNILIYGDPGSGKTWLAGTCQDSPLMADVHFYNVDGGMMTLVDRGDIKATDIRSMDDMEEELHRLAAGDEKYTGVRTLVIDNISELQTLCLEDIASKEYVNRKKKDRNYTIDEIYLDDYGKGGKRMARVLRGFRDLPYNVIYIAHRKDKMRQNTNVLEESKPNLTDKLCNSVMGYMDFVWYLYTAEDDSSGVPVTHRYLLTQPMNSFAAKTRGTDFADRLGPVVVDPTMDRIMDVYNEKENNNA